MSKRPGAGSGERSELKEWRLKMPECLVEVVNVECSGCGLISNNITGWECLEDEIYGGWYYLCPACASE
jgi:hypothetical protein